MIPRLILAALLIGIGSAFAQNMSQMGMAFSNPQPYGAGRARPQDWDKRHEDRSDRPNPMIQVCPDGWGYGPTVSGTQPVCVSPDDDKDNSK